ncbi:MAG: hypothetical protein QOD00_4127 [Blastocatellia bacterium]|jgi:hypothetical protein|nr:hypothetical protein [Blastocatellia bacterium]
MNCQVVRTKIEEAELDQYPGEEAAAHLSACEPCSEFQRERVALRQLVGSLGMVNAPADFDFRLRARLAASKESRRRGLFRFLPAPSAPAIALAASFALLVAAGVIFKQVQFNGHGSGRREQAASATTPAPSSNAPAPQAIKREPTAVAANMDETKSATVSMKHSESGPTILTAEMKPRNRSNRMMKPGEERTGPTAASTVAVGPGGNSSLEFSSRPAPVISLVAVQVPAADQPMKVSLEDGRGTTRTVSLQPVTFGSQELIERKGASRVLASSPKGVW